MASEEHSASGSANSTSGNGGKDWQLNKEVIKQDIADLKSTAETHSKNIQTLQTDVTDIKSKVGVLGEIKKNTGKIQEVVIRMDEKQGNFLTREAYMQDKVEAAKEEVAEVTGVYRLPSESKESGWKKTHTIIAVIASAVALLSALGITIGFRGPEETAATAPTEVSPVETKKEMPEEMKQFMEEQRKFMETINKLIQTRIEKKDAVADKGTHSTVGG